jgi:hypothetical protein
VLTSCIGGAARARDPAEQIAAGEQAGHDRHHGRAARKAQALGARHQHADDGEQRACQQQQQTARQQQQRDPEIREPETVRRPADQTQQQPRADQPQTHIEQAHRPARRSQRWKWRAAHEDARFELLLRGAFRHLAALRAIRANERSGSAASHDRHHRW